jgi:large subunit ribosomal protein L13
MSTFMAKPSEINRKWYVIDAAGKPLGRVAVQAATLLRGKHKTTYTVNVDCGDNVIVLNCKDAVLTGSKAVKKYHYHHTGYIGHMRKVRYDTLMRTDPERAMELAIKGMLPSNTIGDKEKTRLYVYAGNEHNHEAQKPEVWDKI